MADEPVGEGGRASTRGQRPAPNLGDVGRMPSEPDSSLEGNFRRSDPTKKIKVKFYISIVPALSACTFPLPLRLTFPPSRGTSPSRPPRGET